MEEQNQANTLATLQMGEGVETAQPIQKHQVRRRQNEGEP